MLLSTTLRVSMCLFCSASLMLTSWKTTEPSGNRTEPTQKFCSVAPLSSLVSPFTRLFYRSPLSSWAAPSTTVGVLRGWTWLFCGTIFLLLFV